MLETALTGANQVQHFVKNFILVIIEQVIVCFLFIKNIVKLIRSLELLK